MNPKHTIEITIDEAGNITGIVQGVQGKSCSDISKFLDTMGVVKEDRHTDDYHKTPKQGITQGTGK